jgi:hypothetical protein
MHRPEESFSSSLGSKMLIRSDDDVKIILIQMDYETPTGPWS